jgi:enoyl-CoA hydratase
MARPNNIIPHVLVKKHGHMMSIILNRPEVLNSIDHEMVRRIQKALDEAKEDHSVRLVLFYGEGRRGFCAGGDIKAMARAVREGTIEKALNFLEDEYALDLCIHRFPKPLIVLADGITMGGGLGLSAGADIVFATELTKTAMPETRIGFFPDVGATGWMFDKCPLGYPEYLALTGREMTGAECVRVGFATHMTASEQLPRIIELLENASSGLSQEKSEAVGQIIARVDPFLNKKDIPYIPEIDDWVRKYFMGKTSIVRMLEELRRCSIFSDLCGGVFHRLSERSPTALMVTFQLLQYNKGRPIEEVFRADLKAAYFLLTHPDFLEGVRARLIDKDDSPHWRPGSIEEVEKIELDLASL